MNPTVRNFDLLILPVDLFKYSEAMKAFVFINYRRHNLTIKL